MNYTVRDFKGFTNEFGCRVWVSKDEKYFLEKECGRYYLYRCFGKVIMEDGSVSYDNVESCSNLRVPHPESIKKLLEFVNNKEEVARLYAIIDAEREAL